MVGLYSCNRFGEMVMSHIFIDWNIRLQLLPKQMYLQEVCLNMFRFQMKVNKVLELDV